MKTAAIVAEPEIDAGAVVVRVAVEDTVDPDAGGVFLCRMTNYGSVSVELFPPGDTPSASGADRVEAATAAMRYAVDNTARFDALFASLPKD
jgi:hypothetical protein